jgi:diacylglycerol kinase
MDISHPNISLSVRTSTLQNIGLGLRKLLTTDPALTAQILLVIPLIAGGVALGLNAIQWILVSVVTLVFLMAGVFRGAALQQVRRDDSLSSFQVSRIKCMGNALITITAGLSLLTYLMVFVPRIIQIL